MSSYTPPAGSFCWFELATTDLAVAKQFYQSLFGWTSSDHPMLPGEVYTTFSRNGDAVGAAHPIRPGQRAHGVPPHWMLYVAVDDADASAARATTLGGNVIVAPFDVMDLGRMCVVKDPTGAVLSLWQGRKQKGVAVSGVEHSASWADLNTPDQEKAAAFYSALFGWRMVTGKSMEPAKAGDYFHIVNGTDFIGGVPPPHFSDPNTPPSWLIYFEVPDCRRSTAHAMTLGARAFVDTMKAGEEGVISVLADPQGATFALHQG